jgi:hypothetical protein
MAYEDLEHEQYDHVPEEEDCDEWKFMCRLWTTMFCKQNSSRNLW